MLGYALALNSSVTLVRLLSDTEGAQTNHGRLSLGISLVLDLSSVVMMSTLPFMQRAVAASSTPVICRLGKAVLFVLLGARAGTLGGAVHPQMGLVDRLARDLPAHRAGVFPGQCHFERVVGFSFALGAFLAGLVISESIFSHAVLAEVIPLRDIFGLLFFISLGMLVDPAAILRHGWLVLLLLAVASGRERHCAVPVAGGLCTPPLHRR